MPKEKQAKKIRSIGYQTFRLLLGIALWLGFSYYFYSTLAGLGSWLIAVSLASSFITTLAVMFIIFGLIEHGSFLARFIEWVIKIIIISFVIIILAIAKIFIYLISGGDSESYVNAINLNLQFPKPPMIKINISDEIKGIMGVILLVFLMIIVRLTFFTNTSPIYVFNYVIFFSIITIIEMWLLFFDSN